MQVIANVEPRPKLPGMFGISGGQIEIHHTVQHAGGADPLVYSGTNHLARLAVIGRALIRSERRADYLDPALVRSGDHLFIDSQDLFSGDRSPAGPRSAADIVDRF